MKMLPGARQLRILGLCLVISLLVACDQLSPTILSFTANPTSVDAGDNVTLSWVIIGPENLEVTLTPGNIPLSAIGSYTVTPTQTTTYTLTTNFEGSTTSRDLVVAVNIVGEPPVAPPDICNEALVPDDALRFAIQVALGDEEGEFCKDDLLNLSELRVAANEFDDDSVISDLTGLEYATNLTELELGRNISSSDFGHAFSDISALASLTKLTSLMLGDNSITDISALASLTNLSDLNLFQNSISDISVLANLTHLTSLNLSFNQITDVSALAGLTNLVNLRFQSNLVTDVSTLAGLSELSDVRFYRNSVTDISALVANPGLGSGDVLAIYDNPFDLSAGSQFIQDVDELTRRGVAVFYQNDD